MHFAARAAGESKLDRAAVEILAALCAHRLERTMPTRFAVFGTIPADGAVVYLAVLTTFLHILEGPPVRPAWHRLVGASAQWTKLVTLRP